VIGEVGEGRLGEGQSLSVTWEIFKFKTIFQSREEANINNNDNDNNRNCKKNNKACTHVRLILIGFES